MNKNQLGLSLLEILLSLVIIAAILGAVVDHYYDNQQDLQITQAMTQMQQLASVGYEWQAAQSQADFTGISLTVLQKAGLIANNDNYNQINPWGGAFIISADSNDPHYLHISLLQVPTAICNNLREHMKNLAHQQATEKDCSINNYFVAL